MARALSQLSVLLPREAVQGVVGPVCMVMGGHGFLAFSLSTLLAHFGLRVIIVDINPPSRGFLPHSAHMPGMKGNGEILWESADITDKEQLRKLFVSHGPVRTVFHPCAITDIRVCAGPNVDRVNVEGTRNVVELCIEYGVHGLIYTSTVDVLHDNVKEMRLIKEHDLPLVSDESNSTRYGRTKAIAEGIVSAASGRGAPGNEHHEALRTVILRVGHLFGPGDPLIEACNDVPIAIIGREHVLHSVIFVENAAAAHVASAIQLLEDKGAGAEMSGRTFWLKDVDVNYIRFYREVLCGNLDLREEEMTTIKCRSLAPPETSVPCPSKKRQVVWKVPYQLLCMVGLLVDCLVWLVYSLTGYQLGHPVKSFGYFPVQAVSLECTVDDSALRGCIGDYSVVHPVAAIARTRLWYSGVKT